MMRISRNGSLGPRDAGCGDNTHITTRAGALLPGPAPAKGHHTALSCPVPHLFSPFMTLLSLIFCPLKCVCVWACVCVCCAQSFFPYLNNTLIK